MEHGEHRYGCRLHVDTQLKQQRDEIREPQGQELNGDADHRPCLAAQATTGTPKGGERARTRPNTGCPTLRADWRSDQRTRDSAGALATRFAAAGGLQQ